MQKKSPYPAALTASTDDPRSTSSDAVVLQALVKRFGNFTAVEEVSLQIHRAECYALLGPNGAGKTTTIRMISAVSQRDAGEIRVFGLDPWQDQSEVKARLGVVMQGDVFDEDLNVLDNLRIYGRFFGNGGHRFEERIRELLSFVELTGREQMPLQTLSGGMRRRLMIARALLNEPDLLILDEPTTGLDPQVRRALWAMLRRLKARGLTILLTTHYMEEAAQLADRVGILHKGRLIAEDTTPRLIAAHLPHWVLEFDITRQEGALEQIDGEAVIERHGDRVLVFHEDEARLRRWVVEAEIHGAQLRPTSLEDVFVKLTGASLHE